MVVADDMLNNPGECKNKSTQLEIPTSAKKGNGYCTESAGAMIGSLQLLHPLARFVGEVGDAASLRKICQGRLWEDMAEKRTDLNIALCWLHAIQRPLVIYDDEWNAVDAIGSGSLDHLFDTVHSFG